MDPNSQESSNSQNSQNPFGFTGFMNMLGSRPTFPTSNASFPRFDSPPYHQIPPYFYPPNFQAFGGSSSSPFTVQTTQTVEIPEQCTQVNVEEVAAPRRGRGKNSRKPWSWDEDKLVISAWLNTSKDAVKNTDQHGDAFWKRIMQYYMEHKTENAESRDVGQIKNRWRKIRGAVSKFCGAYAEASRNRTSGQSSDDVFNSAITIYLSTADENNFNFQAHWRILKNEPKWMLLDCNSSNNSGGSSKRTRSEEDGGYSGSCPQTPLTEGDDSTPPIRPPGIKATKKRGKQVRSETSNTSATDKYERFYESSGEFAASLNRATEMRSQKLQQQPEKIEAILKVKRMEKINKKIEKEAKQLEKEANQYKLLMMLMEKGNNLNDAEEVLKNKLMQELSFK